MAGWVILVEDGQIVGMKAGDAPQIQDNGGFNPIYTRIGFWPPQLFRQGLGPSHAFCELPTLCSGCTADLDNAMSTWKFNTAKTKERYVGRSPRRL